MMESDTDDCLFETDDQGDERMMSHHRRVRNQQQEQQQQQMMRQQNMIRNQLEGESSNDEAMNDENLVNTVRISGIPVSIAHDNPHNMQQGGIMNGESPNSRLLMPSGASCSTSMFPPPQHLPNSAANAAPAKFNQNDDSQSEASMQVDQPMAKQYSQDYVQHANEYHDKFGSWSMNEQVDFVQKLLDQMCHFQHGKINNYLKPMLQRDFITALPAMGLQHISEKILSYVNSKSLCNCELVSKEWYRVVRDGHLWRRLIERNVRTDSLWKGLATRRGWGYYLTKRGIPEKNDDFYRELYPQIIKEIEVIESDWRGGKFKLSRIQCRSQNSKGVYCLQYDDEKIVSGLRDNTIKLWDKKTLECTKVLQGHTGSVLCLQYDENVIITGSSDSTVRVWCVRTGELINTLHHHCEAVLHLRFDNGLMVTCSKDRSIAVWDMVSAREINMRRVLVGHRAAVNVVDFDEKYIVSASGDRTIKVWVTSTCEFVRTLNGHKRGIACLQYRDNLVVSGSSDNTIRLWNIENGACVRILEGHEELVRCIRFDNKRIVSGAYDGKIKVWDLKAALDPSSHHQNLCIQTLNKHTGRVFRLQFDEFQIISSSHDDSILVWDFLNNEEYGDEDQIEEITT